MEPATQDEAPYVERRDSGTAASDLVAIVGVGLRLPGGVHTTNQLWDVLNDKKSTLCKIPKTRFNADAFYTTSARPGGLRNRHGYFLAESDNLKHVDTDMFSMPRKESAVLDPQAKMLLEVVYECIQNAGSTNWRGGDIGCFVGTFGEDWSDLNAKDVQQTGIPGPYRVCGQHDFALSNRVSFEYDLKGPSCTIKSACSSSLMALHYAVRSIKAHDCSAAIVAGTSLIFTPTATASIWPALSPDGICKSFDASANGYGRGEAINAILVKPLSAALRDNDTIRAVIRGSAINFDGKTPSIMVPNSQSQENMMRKAYADACLDPTETVFVEAHGTGTAVGDPVEANAIARVFSSQEPLYIGSIKPNFGHGEGASGLNSVLKSIAALENRSIPPNIHFDKPNPKIAFDEAKMVVPTKTIPWPENRPERISVNSFGVGGANAHVILESFDSYQKTFAPNLLHSKLLPDGTHQPVDEPRSTLLVLSAANEASLSRTIDEHQQYIQANSSRITDIAYTLCRRREHLSFRSFGIFDGSSIEFVPPQKSQETVQLTMVFTGQGNQWIGMGHELVRDYPEFRNDIDELSAVLSRLPDGPDWSIKEEISKPPETYRLDDACYAQPISTAIQIALVNLFLRWGIRPSSVIGHSSGEIAAAYAAGAITSQEAMLAAYYRGQVAGQVRNRGTMVSVGLSKSAIRTLLQGDVVVGCENSPEAIVLSGEPHAVDETCAKIIALHPNTLIRKLQVDVAYHSHHMQEAAGEYERALHGRIQSKFPVVPMFSTVTGSDIFAPSQLDSDYWSQNMQSPVLFGEALTDLVRKLPQSHAFLEIGGHNSLAGPITQVLRSLKREGDIYVPAMKRAEDCTRTVLEAVGRLHQCGISVDFEKLAPLGKLLVDLPLYQWSHTTDHWFETRVTKQWRLNEFAHHELLGTRILESNNLHPEWRNVFQLKDISWLQDHRIFGKVIFPFAGYVGMTSQAFLQVHHSPALLFNNIVIHRPLVVQESKTYELVTSLRPVSLTVFENSSRWEFSVISYDGQDWTKHFTGEVQGAGRRSYPSKIREHPRRVSNHYLASKQLGADYGPSFRGIENVSALPGAMVASATITPLAFNQAHYAVHPCIIDKCIQMAGIAACEGVFRRVRDMYLPVAIDSLYVCKKASDQPVKAEASITQASSGLYLAKVAVVSGDEMMLDFSGAQFRTLREERPDIVEDTSAGAILNWQPDLDFVNHSKLTEKEFFGLLGHANPTLRVLQIGIESGSSSTHFVDMLVTEASHPMYGHFTYLVTDQQSLDNVREKTAGRTRVNHQIQSHGSSLADFDLAHESFDLVVASSKFFDGDHSDRLSDLRRILQPHGWVFLHGPGHYGNGLPNGDAGLRGSEFASNWTQRFEDSGFSRPQRLVCNGHPTDGEAGFVLRPRSTPDKPSRITLLVPEGETSSFTNSIHKHLLSLNVAIVRKTLSDVSLDDEHVISVLDVQSPFWYNATAANYQGFQSLVKNSMLRSLLWLTRSSQVSAADPSFGISLGLLRTVRQELGVRLVSIELDSLEDTSLPLITGVWRKFTNQKSDELLDPDYEYVIEDNTVKLGRFHPVSVEKDVAKGGKGGDEVALAIDQPGLLESLTWERYESEVPGPNEVLVRTRATGLNFKDMLTSTGFLGQQPLGLEGSGLVEKIGSQVTDFQIGDRVFYLHAGCFSTTIRMPSSSCRHVPDEISFEDAATMPSVYVTAIHCLMSLGNLQKGQSVLIHSACGGVGLAALQICQNIIDAEIYVTVGTSDKVEFLTSSYHIPRSRIFDSRNISFYDGIMEATNGRGVDLVLNSLSGDLLHTSWKCVAEFGKMVEIGKRDFLGKARMRMDPFEANRSFFGVDLSTFKQNVLGPLVDRLLEFLAQGLVAPIHPVQVFDAKDIVESFRYMRNGSRMGKVIVRMPERPSELPSVAKSPIVSFNGNASYLLVGGLGAMGRATSTWMIEHGAREFVYLSRSAGASHADQRFMAELEAQGCSVHAIAGNVADLGVVQKAVKAARKPIKGVFQLSMALPDTAFLDTTFEDWTTGIAAKVDGTWNLHNACPADLDFFILASSIGGCFGQPGESSYAAANTFLDAFVHYRHQKGLPAAVIDFGPVGDMGYITEHPAVYEKLRAAGSYFVSTRDCMQAFHWAIQNQVPHRASQIVSPGRISTGVRSTKPLSSPGNHLPWSRDRRMALYHHFDDVADVNPTETTGNQVLKMFLSRVKEDPQHLLTQEALDLVTKEIGTRIYTALMKPVSELQYDKKLEDIGVDSLAMMEMQNWSRRNFGGIEVSSLEFYKAGTIRGIGMLAVNALKAKHMPEAVEADGALIEEKIAYGDAGEGRASSGKE